MRIGIVSFFDTQQNYGQLLQCFALQNFLKSLGYDIFHLRHNNLVEESLLKKITKIFSSIIHRDFLDYIKLRSENLKNKDKVNIFTKNTGSFSRGFDEFRRKYITFSDSEYSLQGLQNGDIQADVWITGSDQVWGCGPSKLYQLQFGAKNSKRIAYAASMGGFKLTNKFQRRLFKQNLKSFDYISLREEDGVEECRRLGYQKSKLVLDPTFLLEAESYRQIEREPKDSDQYLFLYLLGSPISIEVESIFDWAQKNNLKVKYVASQGREDDFTKANPSPEEWLGLIDNATYVITNSFHGMVFSIIFQKKFLVLPIVGELSRMNSRLSTIMSILQMPKGRVFNGDLSSIKESIDYSNVHKIINEKRQEIINDFRTILSNKKLNN